MRNPPSVAFNYVIVLVLVDPWDPCHGCDGCRNSGGIGARSGGVSPQLASGMDTKPPLSSSLSLLSLSSLLYDPCSLSLVMDLGINNVIETLKILDGYSYNYDYDACCPPHCLPYALTAAGPMVPVGVFPPAVEEEKEEGDCYEKNDDGFYGNSPFRAAETKTTLLPPDTMDGGGKGVGRGGA